MEKLIKLIKLLIPRNKKSLISRVALKKARDYFVNEEKDKARRIVLKTLKKNNWNLRILWIELIAMMEDKTDYELIRNLWIKAPLSISNDLVICNAVARAAAITGHTDESRALLRHLITLANEISIFSSQFSSSKKNQKINNFNKDRNFSNKAAEALKDLYEESVDMPKPFLISGTLLGLIREGKFIGWDKDIDVGIFCNKEKAYEIVKEFRKSKFFVVRKVDITSDRIRLVHINGTMIDVFPHYTDKNDSKVWHDGSASRWWNSPFSIKETEFIGEKVWIPSNPELYLDENYGNWRIPVEIFDARLDAPNVEVTDQEYLTTLHYFSLLSAIKKSKKENINRYSKLLQDTEKDDWFLQFQR